MKKIGVVFLILFWAAIALAGRPTVSGGQLADLGKCDSYVGKDGRMVTRSTMCVVAEATHPEFDYQLIQFIDSDRDGKCNYAILFEQQESGKWTYVDTTECGIALTEVKRVAQMYDVDFRDLYKEAK